jgi:hypothetical protein
MALISIKTLRAWVAESEPEKRMSKQFVMALREEIKELANQAIDVALYRNRYNNVLLAPDEKRKRRTSKKHKAEAHPTLPL